MSTTRRGTAQPLSSVNRRSKHITAADDSDTDSSDESESETSDSSDDSDASDESGSESSESETDGSESESSDDSESESSRPASGVDGSGSESSGSDSSDDSDQPSHCASSIVNTPICIDIDSLKRSLSMNKLPKELTISTMTITCCTGTKINRKNVAYYIDLHPNRISSVRFGSNPVYERRLTPLKKKMSKKKSKVVNTTKTGKVRNKKFYNQTTIEIHPDSGNNPINMKLFRNGSLQMTGVKSVDDFISVMSKLFCEFTKVRAVVKNNIIRPKLFVTDMSKLHVYNIKVNLINTNFRTGFEVDRVSLHSKLLVDKIRSTYQPCMHSAVNVKYYHTKDSNVEPDENSNKVSIFVFESGALIITGGGCIEHIRNAYRFIVGKLNEYGHRIVLIKTEQIVKESTVFEKFMSRLPDPLPRSVSKRGASVSKQRRSVK